MIPLKSSEDIRFMRESNQIVFETLELLSKQIQPGITTKELDEIAEAYIRSRDATPAFLGFKGFPATICASIDEEVVHGIPSSGRILQEGQIISIDVGVLKNGYYGDSARTFPVGKINDLKKRLLKVTEEALYLGIKQAIPGNRLSDIGYAIQSYVEKNGFSVVRALVGHGIGRHLHEEPQVQNYGPPGKGPLLKPGMTLAIEPMINVGSYDVFTNGDGWTVITIDRKPSAHFEHTIAITHEGPEILSQKG